MHTLDLIKTRRSIRKYKNQPISNEILYDILEAGRWAPSGLNNQPWRFVVIKDDSCREKLSELTNYGNILKKCDLAIVVFYNNPEGYNRDKDLMSIGSCIQNMMLQAHSCGIGSVWLGEILKNKDELNEILEMDPENEPAAVIAMGYPDETPEKDRKGMNEILVKII